jgi:hypothetical protein
MFMTSVSFFNELATERNIILKASISFFNELATERRNCAYGISLMMASKRIMLWKEIVSRGKTQSWIPRDLHWMEENHSRSNTC